MKTNRKGPYLVEDIYEEYAEKLLKDNPSYWSRSNRSHSVRHYFIYTTYRSDTGLNEVVEVISYKRFRKIVVAWMEEAVMEITQGAKVKLGHNLGDLEPRRVERNFSNKQVDWEKTHANGRNELGKYNKIVLRTDPDYVRIAWVKLRKLPGEKSYEFKPAGGKKGAQSFFSQANKQNPNLKYRYKYFPYIMNNGNEARQSA